MSTFYLFFLATITITLAVQNCNPIQCVQELKPGMCLGLDGSQVLASSANVNYENQCFISDFYAAKDLITLYPWKEQSISAVQNFGGNKKWTYIKNKFCAANQGKWQQLMQCDSYCSVNVQNENTCDLAKFTAKHVQLSALGKQGYEQCNLDSECASLECLCVPHEQNANFTGRCAPLRTDKMYQNMFKFVCLYGHQADIFVEQFDEISCAFYIMLTFGGVVTELKQNNCVECLKGFTDYNTLIHMDTVLERIHKDMIVFETMPLHQPEGASFYGFSIFSIFAMLSVGVITYKCCGKPRKREESIYKKFITPEI